MLKSDEIMLRKQGILPEPDMKVIYDALDIPETVLEDPTPYNGLYGNVINYDDLFEWRCPNCGTRFVTYKANNRCSDCGQKLDWEDWQEEMK